MLLKSLLFAYQKSQSKLIVTQFINFIQFKSKQKAATYLRLDNKFLISIVLTNYISITQRNCNQYNIWNGNLSHLSRKTHQSVRFISHSFFLISTIFREYTNLKTYQYFSYYTNKYLPLYKGGFIILLSQAVLLSPMSHICACRNALIMSFKCFKRLS